MVTENNSLREKMAPVCSEKNMELVSDTLRLRVITRHLSWKQRKKASCPYYDSARKSLLRVKMGMPR